MKKLLLIFFTSALACSASAQTKRIMPLGNSITQADAIHVSYRYNLWNKLNDADRNFDFVGSETTHNGGGTPPYPDMSFDRHHEGHWGWFADEILNGRASNPSDKLSTWLTTYTPDIVLMHLGSNDAFNSHSTSSTIEELEEIIDVIRDDNPNVIILLAQLIPALDAGRNARVNELNAAIPGIVSSKNTPQSPIILVDQNSGFDPAVDTYDGVHPDESGEEKMAQKWYTALLPFVPLPIKLLSFDGKTEKGKVKLSWSTATEDGNEFFTVEHSPDGKVFEDIERIDGGGNSLIQLHYNTIHHRPVFGVNYYRLKQTDFDGKSTYSKVIAVHIDDAGQLTIYPNPAIDELFIDFSKEERDDRLIEIVDLSGKKHLEHRSNGEAVVKVSLKDLPIGMYIIHVTSRKGGRFRQKITVH